VGLVEHEDVENIILVRKNALINIDKIVNINPPGVMRWLPLFEIWRLFTLVSLGRRCNVDVFVGIQLVIHGVQARLAGWLVGKPAVISVIGDDVHQHLLVKWTRFLLFPFIRYADAVTVMGGKSEQIVEQIGVSPDRVKIIQNYQDTEKFHYRSVEKKWDLIFVGELLPRKRVADMISMIAKSEMPLRAVIIGSGILLAELQQQASTIDSDSTIEFVNYTDSVEEYLSQSKVLILPSELEALPAVLVEAMYCGIPVVTTDICDIPSQFDDGKGSYLFSVGDVSAMGRKVEALLTDPVFYQAAVAECLAWSDDHRRQWSKRSQVESWDKLLVTINHL
jgi:glycosyltransferase involved in cell wall biosynthesis